MIRKIAWDAFKKTGDINTFLEFKQIENIENDIKDIGKIQKITNMNLESSNEINNLRGEDKEINGNFKS